MKKIIEPSRKRAAVERSMEPLAAEDGDDQEDQFNAQIVGPVRMEIDGREAVTEQELQIESKIQSNHVTNEKRVVLSSNGKFFF